MGYKNITISVKEDIYEEFAILKKELNSKSFSSLIILLFNFYQENSGTITEMENKYTNYGDRLDMISTKISEIENKMAKKDDIDLFRMNLEMTNSNLNLLKNLIDRVEKNQEELSKSTNFSYLKDKLDFHEKMIEKIISSFDKTDVELDKELIALFKGKSKFDG